MPDGLGSITGVGAEALDRLMPMHAILDADGTVLHAGPTLHKILPDTPLTGQPFLDLFETRRPRDARTIQDLFLPSGQSLHLRLRDGSGIRLKGIALPLPDADRLIVNLAFGISVRDAIRRFNLSAGDFASTDLMIEMLYVMEAKEAVSAESRMLNMRLLNAKSEAEEQAFTDTLTGLRNRRAMDVILENYRSCQDRFSVLSLDLDHFKAVNDTLGHAAGDTVLRQVGAILLDETREDDVVVRLGGDEFVILLHRVTDTRALGSIAGRILARIAQPIRFEGKDCRVSGSIGITRSVDYTQIEPEQMLIDADVALYAAKSAGRAQHRFVSDVGGVGQKERGAISAA